MSLFGNMGPTTQVQQAPQTVGVLPQAQDPQSQYLAEALKSIGQPKQMGNPMGLATNLLASALDDYRQNRPQQQGAQPPAWNSQGMDPTGSLLGQTQQGIAGPNIDPRTGLMSPNAPQQVDPRTLY